MAGTVPFIAAGTIASIEGLEERPVYFVTMKLPGSPKIVVKGDAAGAALRGMSDLDAQVSIAWSSKLMKNVNNRLVNSKIMTTEEVRVFKEFAVQAFVHGTRQHANVAAGGPVYNWVKMPMVTGLSDADTYKTYEKVDAALGTTKQVASPSIAAVKNVLVRLSDSAAWTDLGKVLAVDLFTGNGDRFDVITGEWVNDGNLMFLTGGTTKVIGLDTFNPNGQDLSNLNTKGGYDQMRVLTDAQLRRAFAQSAAVSIGERLKNYCTRLKVEKFTIAVREPDGMTRPQEVRANDLGTIFNPYIDDLDAGIAQGAAALKDYLTRKAAQYGSTGLAASSSSASSSTSATSSMSASSTAPAPMRRARATGHVTPPMLVAAPSMPPVVPLSAATASVPEAVPWKAATIPTPPPKALPKGIQERMAYLGW